MFQYFKGNFFLFFVCCNGLKDFLVFFEKDYVRECLVEKWKFFYFVYIVFVFNNIEILGELIEIGVDVNLKIIDENFWIFLILVVGNDIDEIKENDMRKFFYLNWRSMI